MLHQNSEAGRYSEITFPPVSNTAVRTSLLFRLEVQTCSKRHNIFFAWVVFSILNLRDVAQANLGAHIFQSTKNPAIKIKNWHLQKFSTWILPVVYLGFIVSRGTKWPRDPKHKGRCSESLDRPSRSYASDLFEDWIVQVLFLMSFLLFLGNPLLMGNILSPSWRRFHPESTAKSSR